MAAVPALPVAPMAIGQDKKDAKEDTKSTSPSTPSTTSTSDTSKTLKFPGYVFVADGIGEVVRANDSKVTLRITWFQQTNANNRRPNLHQNHRNYRNPFAPNMNRPKNVQVKEVHHDYTLEYLPESVVRVRTLPPKFDENGKKVQYTQKEIDELKIPTNIPGYAASRSDVVPGTFLEVYLLCEKSIPVAKVTDADLRIKYAVIWGKDPNPPKDIANPPKSKN
jgi:hypothetical protein